MLGLRAPLPTALAVGSAKGRKPLLLAGAAGAAAGATGAGVGAGVKLNLKSALPLPNVVGAAKPVLKLLL
jgi:hypothetical protein